MAVVGRFVRFFIQPPASGCGVAPVSRCTRGQTQATDFLKLKTSKKTKKKKKGIKTKERLNTVKRNRWDYTGGDGALCYRKRLSLSRARKSWRPLCSRCGGWLSAWVQRPLEAVRLFKIISMLPKTSRFGWLFIPLRLPKKKPRHQRNSKKNFQNDTLFSVKEPDKQRVKMKKTSDGSRRVELVGHGRASKPSS